MEHGHETDDKDTGLVADIKARDEDQGLVPGTHGIVARDSFRARERERRDYPELGLPTPEEILGDICHICHGMTWVVRGNADIPGPIMAQLEPCDNPDGCPQIKKFGVRPIIHLALPHNHLNRVVTLPNSDQITALMEG